MDAVSGPPFLGVWRDLDLSVPEANRVHATFGADGTYTLSQQSTTRVGSWALEPDGKLRLSISGYSTAGKYYLTENRFVTDIFEPVGEVDGVVGEWQGTAIAGTTPVDNVIVLRSDGSHTFTRRFDDTMTVWDGTYTYSPERSLILLSFTSAGSPSNQVYIRALPGVALGDQVLERVPL